MVDDDPATLKITFDVLTRTGISVKVAHSGERALKQLEHGTVDVILLDVMMHGLSGFETCKQLKAKPHTQHIPVIFMTALTSASSIAEGYEVGGSDYITKPFYQDELLARIKTHLRIRRLQDDLKIRNDQLQQHVHELQATQLALQQAHNHLETRVEMRTAELEDANSRLEQEIIEHRWTERALRESERRFRHFITSISDHIYVMRLAEDGQWNSLYISPNVKIISGYPQRKFINDANFWRSVVIHPADQSIAATQLAALSRQKNVEVEYRIVRADGKALSVRDSARAVRETDSVTVYGVISDITARNQLQEQLHAIYNASQELTLLHDESAILERVFEIIGQVLKFERASYGLLNDKRDELHYWVYSPEGWRAGFTLPVSSKKGIGPVVVRSKKSLLLTHALEDPRYESCDPDWSACAELCVPMKVNGKVIGVLDLESEDPDRFTVDDQLLLQTLADQTAIALQSARFFAEVQERAAEFNALAEAGRAMSSSLDLSIVLQQTLNIARQMLGAEGVAILLHDAHQGDLYFAAAASPGAEQMLNKRVPLQGSVAGWSFLENQPVLVSDAKSNRHFYSNIDQATGLITQSLLAVPLTHSDKTIGVIEASNKPKGAFNQKDLKKLEALAYAAAISIENARLFEQVQSGRQQLRHLAQEVVKAQEEERQRLSYELHDEAGQTLTGLKFSLELLQGELPDPESEISVKLGEAVDLTITLTKHLRAMARDLRPPALDVTGLDSAIDDHCFEFAKRTGLEINYQGTEVDTLSEPAKIFLYRFVQEGLNNVAKHAQADRVEVILAVEAEHVELSIKDDGIGFNVDAINNQLLNRVDRIGLLGLQERLDLLGGSLQISSQPGQGTQLSAILPSEINND